MPNFGNRSLWVLVGILAGTTLLITVLGVVAG